MSEAFEPASEPDPFFDQDFTKLKTRTKARSRKAVKSTPFPVTLYEDNRKELEELARELAELTGRNTRNPNCSVAARAAISYTLNQMQSIEERQKLVDIYYRSGSRR